MCVFMRTEAVKGPKRTKISNSVLQSVEQKVTDDFAR